MRVYKFMVRYLKGFDYDDKMVVVNGAESLHDAFKRAIDQCPNDAIRDVRLIDNYIETRRED